MRLSVCLPHVWGLVPTRSCFRKPNIKCMLNESLYGLLLQITMASAKLHHALHSMTRCNTVASVSQSTTFVQCLLIGLPPIISSLIVLWLPSGERLSGDHTFWVSIYILTGLHAWSLIIEYRLQIIQGNSKESLFILHFIVW